ncbi:hypothetical protein A4A49_07565 [Nicotiana attenuata]|uniref:Uncharacterized protein n=1 Tax=Nicotiana attenuata TaxID=49451 RepID=A0A1J6IIA4_NICAT|nr:hypothetical protein A4A49_07565 [Nicotiana attenuata]
MNSAQHFLIATAVATQILAIIDLQLFLSINRNKDFKLRKSETQLSLPDLREDFSAARIDSNQSAKFFKFAVGVLRSSSSLTQNFLCNLTQIFIKRVQT